MADGLFSYKTPGQLQQDYLGGLMQPVGGGDLYSQLIQTMSNAGRIAGYGAGRMFGGQVPGEEKNAAIQSVFEQVKDIQDPTQQYTAASQLFLKAGFPDLAMQARKTAQTEQLTGLQLRKTKAEVKEIEDKPAAAAAAQQRKLTTITSLVPNINPNLAAGLASPSGEKAYTAFLSSQFKTKAPDTEIGKLIAARDALPEGHPDRKLYQDKLLKLTNTNNEASALGVLAQALVKATGSKAGQEIGRSVTQLPKQEEAANSVEQALKLLEKGIYSGFYGGTGEFVAKVTGGAIGNAERVANTELFRNLVGQTIIPRLEEFGGNDSVEELLFLKRVQGGDTSMTKEALVATLKNVEKMIQRGIQLKRAQEKAISEDKPPPMALPDEPKKRTVRKRYNPATGLPEVVEE